ncbi:hypothetical protein Gpo141_00012166 [Globisporangium polare]
MKTFESARAPIQRVQQGLKYKNKAIFAGGLAVAAYFFSGRKDNAHSKAPAEDFTGAPVHPTPAAVAARESDRNGKR